MYTGPMTYTFDELLEHKKAGKASETALAGLRREADEILDMPFLRVTDKRLKAVSGNNHDYMSMGLYWWPNPDTPDGLPYIRRDGYANPDSKDGINPSKIYERVRTLALAAFYFEDKASEYADYANRQLYEWFINPETYMSPHAKYAQAIPGICDGRCTGLIDFAYSYALFNGIGILESLGLADAEIVSGVRDWFVKFTDWMLTDRLGIEECNDTDNHGSWYDAQIITAAVFCGRTVLAKNISLTAYDRRLRTLVESDGSQPAELRRTQAINYSIYNLKAMIVIASVAERLGYQHYWGIDEQRGVPILKQAVDYLYPYVSGEKEFSFEEFHPERCADGLSMVMRSVLKRYPDDEYEKKILALGKEAGLEPAN